MKRAIVVLCSWASALCLALAYLAIGWGIDEVVGGHSWSTWWLALVGALASGFFAWAVSALGATVMKQLEPSLRHSMIRQVFALGPSQRTNERAGRVVNSATDGVERVAAYKGTFLAPMIASLTTPILVVVFVALVLDPVAAGFLAIAIPLVPICVMGFRKAFKPVSSRYRHASRQLAAKELDAIQGLGDLALMNAGKDMGKRLAEAAEEVRSKVMSYLAGNQLILLVIDSVFSLGMITGAIALALIRYQQGALSVGGALSLVLLSSIMLDPLDRIGQFFYIGMGGIAATREIKRFTSETPEVIDPAENGVLAPISLPEPGEVRIDSVSFAYEADTPILRGASLRVAPGEHIAITGTSGAGKSTLSSLIQAHHRPSEGSIFINGVDISQVPLQWVRSQIAVVEQTTYLFSDTLRANILIANPAASDEDILAALRTVGLDDLYIHVFGHGFNGSYGCTSAAHHHDILHIYIVFFAYNLSNERYVLASCHEICHVIELKFIVSTRYNRIAIALDCHNMIRIIRPTDVF